MCRSSAHTIPPSHHPIQCCGLTTQATGGQPGTGQGLIDLGVTSANRAAALTHRLLAFSRRQSLDRKPLDPNHLVTSLEELFRRTKGAHIELCVELGKDIWTVNTDASQLESALLNLIINKKCNHRISKCADFAGVADNRGM